MALSEVLATFLIDTKGLKKATSEGDSAIAALTGKLKSFGSMLTGGIVVNGIQNMVSGLIDQGSALNDTSAKLGIGTDALQQWGFAAKLSGVEAGELDKSLTVLQKNIAKNAANGARTGGPFATLGVQLRDAKGEMRETTDILQDTGLAIAKLKSPAERTAAAMEIFGKSGAKLNPLFADGEEGLRKYLAELDRAGGGISADAIAQLDNLGDEMDRFEMATTSAKVKVLGAFMPMLTRLTRGAADWLGGITKTREGVEMLGTAMTTMAVAGVGAALAFVGPWLPAITGFTFLGLLVQDFIVGLQGGESEIGDIIKQLFGEGSGESFFAKVNIEIQKAIDSMKEAWKWLSKLRGTPDEVANKVNNKVSREIDSALHDSAHELLGTDTLAASMQKIMSSVDVMARLPPEVRESMRNAELEKEARALISENDIRTNNDRVLTRGWDNPMLEGGTQTIAQMMDDAALLKQTVAEMKQGIDPTFTTPRANIAGAPVGSGPSTSSVTQTNTMSVTINADSDPDAIADAAGGTLLQQLRSAGDSLRRTVRE